MLLTIIDLYENEDTKACMNQRSDDIDQGRRKMEFLPCASPILDLKPIPSSLRYSFDDHHEARLVIISVHLIEDQDNRLLNVWRGNEAGIGWILDLKGLEPSLYTRWMCLDVNSFKVRMASH